MTCLLCKGEMKPSTTIHTVQLKNCVVVIPFCQKSGRCQVLRRLVLCRHRSLLRDGHV